MTSTLEKSSTPLLTSIEFLDNEGNSTVNNWAGIVATSIIEQSGRFIEVTYELPADASASAALFALIGGSNLATIRTHRSNADGTSCLSIRHHIDRVESWEINSSIVPGANKAKDQLVTKTEVSITYSVESAILFEDSIESIG